MLTWSREGRSLYSITYRAQTTLEILRVLGLESNSIDSLAKDIPKNGTLEGDFKVYIKKGRQKRVLSIPTMNHVLRNIDHDDLKVSGGGENLAGDFFKLSADVKVESTGSWLDREDAIQQIREQLERWSQERKIDL